MKAAKALHGNNGPFMQKFGCARENRIAGLKGAAPQRSVFVNIGAVKGFVRRGGFRKALFPPGDMRAAFEACVGLCMETSVGRVAIFGVARFAHGEACHGSFRAIIREAVDNREARSAIRAIDEWVMVAAVVRVEQLGHAFVACCQVGRYQGGRVGFGFV